GPRHGRLRRPGRASAQLRGVTMAGDLKLKQQQAAAYALQDNTSSDLTNASAVAAATAAIDNATNLADTDAVELVGKAATGWGSAVGPGVTVDLYLVPALDGTNYGDVDVSTPTLPANCYVGSFTTVAASTTNGCRLVITGIPLQPRKYKAYIKNNAGQTLKA